MIKWENSKKEEIWLTFFILIWTVGLKFGNGSIVDWIYEVMIVTVMALINVENMRGVLDIGKPKNSNKNLKSNR